MTGPEMRVMLQIEYGNGVARSMVNLGATNTQPATIGFALGLQVEALRELAIERNSMPEERITLNLGEKSGMTSPQ